MTRDETKLLIKAISGLYPNFKMDDPTLLVDMWSQVMADYPLEEAKKALLVYAREDVSGFAPTPGKLINITGRQYTTQMNELEAWSMVRKAISNAGYHAEEEFEKLPTEVQKAIGGPSYLRDRALDENYNEAVESSNFARSFRAIQERQRHEISSTPFPALVAAEKPQIESKTSNWPPDVERASPERIEELMARFRDAV